MKKDDKRSEYRGVKLVTLFTIRIQTLETIIHTFLAVLWAWRNKADIIHIHAIGPALYVPMAKRLGMKVVFTHHGPDYDRLKWGRIAKWALRRGERAGSRKADEVIVISEVIRNILEVKHKRYDTNLIFNGFATPALSVQTDYVESLGLVPRRYVFTLGRFVEEKGFDLLIRAFKKTGNGDYRLVIAGDADHDSSYSTMLKKLAQSENVVLTGFVRGKELGQLFNNAALFVLPSFHEGLPISLLEAMSYSLPVIVSDIPANMQVNLPAECYFKTGDEDALRARLDAGLAKEFHPVVYDLGKYDWDQIASQTAEVYNRLKPNDESVKL